MRTKAATFPKKHQWQPVSLATGGPQAGDGFLAPSSGQSVPKNENHSTERLFEPTEVGRSACLKDGEALDAKENGNGRLIAHKWRLVQ
jgi:hypothetical protein